MKILGIETSCDETAAAVVEDGVRILSNVVVSQIDIFAAYGGVIPEVAARSHLEAMLPVVDKAMADAGVNWDEIDAIAVTYAPGLLGSLLIGTLTARTLAILHEKPLLAVHHLKAHVYANWLGGATGADSENSRQVQEPQFPLLALVVSGGHTQILYMPAHDRFEIIGTTRDDAVGECFDKVAKILGLPYPGGPAIAAAAKGGVKRVNWGGAQEGSDRDTSEAANDSGVVQVKPGDPEKYRLPHPRVEGLDFSFSGLKTAVLRAVQKAKGVPISFPSHQLAERLSAQEVADFAASFQRTAVEILVEKLKKALEEHPEVKSLVLAGGVAANDELRRAVLEAFAGGSAVGPQNGGENAQKGSEGAQGANVGSRRVYFPAAKLSGDNGAMVAAAAYFEIQAGAKPADPYKLNIYPRISIEE